MALSTFIDRLKGKRESVEREQAALQARYAVLLGKLAADDLTKAEAEELERAIVSLGVSLDDVGESVERIKRVKELRAIHAQLEDRKRTSKASAIAASDYERATRGIIEERTKEQARLQGQHNRDSLAIGEADRAGDEVKALLRDYPLIATALND